MNTFPLRMNTMTNYQNFKTKEEEDRFYQIFDEKLEVYKTLLDKVKDKLFVDHNYEVTYMGLSGAVLKEICDITEDLFFQTMDEYKTPVKNFEEDFFKD
jgi:hypothetical protein